MEKEKKKTLRHLGEDSSFIGTSLTYHLIATTTSLYAHNKQMGLANIWKLLAAIGNS